MLYAEAKKKFEIFYKGALKHGNLEKAFILENLFKKTFADSVINFYKSLI